jgi:hypothetical protein
MGKKTRDDVYLYTLAKQCESMLEKARQWATRQPNVKILYVSHQEVIEWATRQPNVKILYVSHQEVIEAPFNQASRVAEFLDYEILPELRRRSSNPDSTGRGCSTPRTIDSKFPDVTFSVVRSA